MTICSEPAFYTFEVWQDWEPHTMHKQTHMHTHTL